MFTWIIFTLMFVLGIIDLWLMFTKRDTISKRYHRMFPQAIDNVIMVITLAAVWILFGVEVFTPVMLGTIFGHLFWRE